MFILFIMSNIYYTLKYDGILNKARVGLKLIGLFLKLFFKWCSKCKKKVSG